jgi:predicted enzyme related to lactoylglutathione lyase
VWNELHTPNQPGAWKFYRELFGWKQEGEMDMDPLGKDQLIQHGTMLGAMMPNSATGMPPRWNQYFQVEDIDAAKAAVQAGGGKVTQGPDESLGGQFAMDCIDPQGAAFGLVGPRQR